MLRSQTEEHCYINMELQRATPSDIQTLFDIEKTTQGLKTYSRYLTEDEVRDYINNEIVFIIKKDNEIVGHISYEIKGEKYFHLSGLVIKPEFQRQGLAKEAISKLLEIIGDYKTIDLTVHPENPATNLYKSFGFTIKERIENYFGDGEPRLRMALEK